MLIKELLLISVATVCNKKPFLSIQDSFEGGGCVTVRHHKRNKNKLVNIKESIAQGVKLSAKILQGKNQSYILFILLAIGLVAGIVGSLSTGTIRIRELKEFSEQVLNETVIQLDSKFKAYETISLQFVTNRSLNRLLSEYVKVRDFYAFSGKSEQFSSFFDGYAFADGSIYDAVFLDEINGQRKALTMGEDLSNRFIQNLRHSQIFQDSIAANGEVVWGKPIRAIETGQWLLPVGRRIKHLYTGEPLGVIIIFISEVDLIQAVNDYLNNNFYFSVGTFKHNYTMVVDEDGTIVMAPLHQNVGQNYRKSVRGRRRIGLAGQDKSGSTAWLATIQRQPVLMVKKRIPQTKWYLMVPVSLAEEIGGWSWVRVSPGIAVGCFLGMIIYGGLLWRRRKQGSISELPQQHMLNPGLESRPGEPLSTSDLPVQPIGETSAPPPWLAELSERERTILRLIAQGYNNKEIANRMFVAEQTIKNYISVIYNKIGVHDRVHASLKAIEAGLDR